MTQQMDLQKGLVGHWTMDDNDTSGGTLYDRSAYDNHGTLTNSPTTGASGKLGEAYDFDSANNEQVLVSDSPSLNNYDEVTISAWFNADTFLDSFYDMLGKGNVLTIRVNDTGSGHRPFFDTSINGGRVYRYIDNFSVTGWNHVVAVYDSSEQRFDIYINANKSSEPISDPNGDIGNPIDSTNADFTIANGTYPSPIDDVRMYDRALSDSEVNQLYQMREQRLHNV